MQPSLMKTRTVLISLALVAVPASALFAGLKHVEAEFPTHVKFVDVEGLRALREAARIAGFDTGQSALPAAQPEKATSKEPQRRASQSRKPSPAITTLTSDVTAAIREFLPTPKPELIIQKKTLSDGTSVYEIRQD